LESVCICPIVNILSIFHCNHNKEKLSFHFTSEFVLEYCNFVAFNEICILFSLDDAKDLPRPKSAAAILHGKRHVCEIKIGSAGKEEIKIGSTSKEEINQFGSSSKEETNLFESSAKEEMFESSTKEEIKMFRSKSKERSSLFGSSNSKDRSSLIGSSNSKDRSSLFGSNEAKGKKEVGEKRRSSSTPAKRSNSVLSSASSNNRINVPNQVGLHHTNDGKFSLIMALRANNFGS
jgi:hypothetical protein